MLVHVLRTKKFGERECKALFPMQGKGDDDDDDDNDKVQIHHIEKDSDWYIFLVEFIMSPVSIYTFNT